MILQHMHKYVQRSRRFASLTSGMHDLNFVLDNGTKPRHINRHGRRNSPGQPKLPGAADDRHLPVSMRDGIPAITILRELPSSQWLHSYHLLYHGSRNVGASPSLCRVPGGPANPPTTPRRKPRRLVRSSELAEVGEERKGLRVLLLPWPCDLLLSFHYHTRRWSVQYQQCLVECFYQIPFF